MALIPVRSARGAFILGWGLLAVTAFLFAGCGGGDDSPTAVDTTPPGMVTNLLATVQADAVVLTWNNPTDSDFDGIQVRRDTLATPTASTGTLVYSGMVSSYTDDTITPGQNYIYAVFTRDATGNTGAPATITVGTNAPVPVAFVDPDLADAVRSALGLQPGDILRTDMLGLTELDISRLGIEDITGLEYALNLGKLVMEELGTNPPGGLDALQSLVNLWELDARSNGLTALPDLTGLPRLRNLYLDGNLLTSLTPFAHMPALSQFSCSGTGITNLTPLAGLTTLTSLQLAETGVMDLSPLTSLTGLTALRIFTAPVSDLGPLASLTNLHSLSVTESEISDLSPLTGLIHLTEIQIPQNHLLHDLQALVDNTGLGSGTTLIVGSCPLLHDALAVQIPALESRGVNVLPFTSLPEDLVGIWEAASATLNGESQDLAEFFDWDPTSVSMNVFFYANRTYRVQELDAEGSYPYTETGTVTVDGTGITLHQLTENGVEITAPEDFVASWAMNGNDLEITQTDAGDTAVIDWTRLPE